jgi:SAM-dependent methyltransferase
MELVEKMTGGEHHYMAYVGPAAQYDFMGATQFRLLCALGLRARHRLLDFGCGSLRAGRFFMTYLNEGCYHGVEPNRWLVEDARENQVGADLFRIKKPSFDHNDRFAADGFGTTFDFILAQSIFSHTGTDLVRTALGNFARALNDDGLVVATFVEGRKDYEGGGWVYPKCVTFRPATIERFAREALLVAARLPWYHPRQAWYVLAKRRSRLPSRGMMRYLRGAVLFDPEFTLSWSLRARARKFLSEHFGAWLPAAARGFVRKWVS